MLVNNALCTDSKSKKTQFSHRVHANLNCASFAQAALASPPNWCATDSTIQIEWNEKQWTDWHNNFVIYSFFHLKINKISLNDRHLLILLRWQFIWPLVRYFDHIALARIELRKWFTMRMRLESCWSMQFCECMAALFSKSFECHFRNVRVMVCALCICMYLAIEWPQSMRVPHNARL